MYLGMTRSSVSRRQTEAGFTLVELLVVLVILGLLAAVATPQVMKYLGRARTDAAKVQIQGLSAALDLYHLDMGRYPNEQEGLAALAERPPSGERWRGPYVRKRDMLIDPWGRPYRYRLPGRNGDYDLFTYGADDTEGGSGDNQDVTSW
jgi:general secretion pathway protein G